MSVLPPKQIPYHLSAPSQSTALSCVCRRCIKGQPGSSWPQKMTTANCVMPPSVHWRSRRPTIRARITPRSCGSLKPSRAPVTCKYTFNFTGQLRSWLMVNVLETCFFSSNDNLPVCCRDGSSEAAPRRNRKDGSEYRLVKNRRSPQLPVSVSGKTKSADK